MFLHYLKDKMRLPVQRLIIPTIFCILLPLPVVAQNPAGISEAACDQRAKDLMQVTRDWTQSGKRNVAYDTDGFWKALGPDVNYNKLTNYITKEDGVVKPVRSGHEVALYNKIKEFVSNRNAGDRLDMSKLLRMGLDSCSNAGGEANLQITLLTIHNVVRILARPQQWSGPGIAGDYGHPETDPAYPILQDLQGRSSTGGPTFPAMMGIRQKPSGEVGDPLWSMRTLFDQQKGAFENEPGAINAEWNAGCHYYHWIGGLARSTLGSAAIMGGIVGEIRAKDATGNRDQGVIEVSDFVCGSIFGSEAFRNRAELKPKSEKDILENNLQKCNGYLDSARTALDAGDPEKASALLMQYNDEKCYELPGVKLMGGLEDEVDKARGQNQEAAAEIKNQAASCEYEKAYEGALDLQRTSPNDPWIMENFDNLKDLAEQQKKTRDLLREAQSLVRAKDINKALDVMEEARQRAPNCMSGPIQSLIDEINERLKGFKEATSRASDAANKCDYAGALKAAQEAERISPDHPWVQENLPKIKDLLKRKVEAESLIQQAVTQSQTAANANDWDQIVAVLEQARSSAPSCLFERIDSLIDAAKNKKGKKAEKSIILLIDTSGSMSDNNKIGNAKNAAVQAVRKMGQSTEIAIMSFSGGCGSPTSLVCKFSSDVGELISAIESLSPGGGTPLAPAVGVASEYMKSSAQGKSGEIILMTDGQNDCGAISDATNAVRSSSIPTSVSTIGFDIESNPRATEDLRTIASQTGGRSYSAKDQRELVHAFSRALLLNAIKKDDPVFSDPAVGPQVQSHFARAENLLQNNDFPGALVQYQQAYKIAPASPAVNYNLSLVYEEQDQLNPAIQHAERYLALAPSSFDQGEVQARISSMRQELTRNPREMLDPTACRDVYSWARSMQDQTRKSKNPAQKVLLFNILIGAQKGDCENARADQQKYKSLYPSQ